MASNLSAYRCILLGHSEGIIQESLDNKLKPGERIIAIEAIGVNVVAIVECPGPPTSANSQSFSKLRK